MPDPSFLPSLATSAVAVVGWMLFVWTISVSRRNAGHGDVGWGLALPVVALIAFAMGDAMGARRYLLPALVALWGLRLSASVGWRNLAMGLHPGGEMNLKEDRRYASLRRRWGPRFALYSLPTIFLGRALLALVLSLPLLLAQAVPGRTPLFWLDYLGVLLFGVGMVIEIAADSQLLHFRLNPGSHGQVLTTGLWRYTRHPNYFGSFLGQTGIALVAVAARVELWPVLAVPALFGLLLARGSGVPVCERGIEQRRPRYAEYRARTSAFLPWFPRRGKRQAPVAEPRRAAQAG